MPFESEKSGQMEHVSRGASRAGSMPRAGGDLLPNEPSPAMSQEQSVLTQRYLLPKWAELEAFFRELRRFVDSDLQKKQPSKLGKPYPLGQCLEITAAVEGLLRQLDRMAFTGPALEGYGAFKAFCGAGGSIRQVWGDLRGSYFQNAFQLGALYVDVSNDTVVPSKPQVEILPFDQANFSRIADFRHFVRIAQSYWQGRIYPNHLLPSVAPLCPLVRVASDGSFLLHDATAYMVHLTLNAQLAPSEEVLMDEPMPSDIFDHARACLAVGGFMTPQSPESGRTLALDACRRYRAMGLTSTSPQTHQMMNWVLKANQHLAGAAPLPPEYGHIDPNLIAISQQSPAARQELEMLMACESKLRDLQRDTAKTQTARNTCAAALRALLVGDDMAAGAPAKCD